MGSKLNNPFTVYGYEGPDYFCDRRKETENIINGLYNERNIVLLAPRRLGKSGLIHHVFGQIAKREPDTVCIYIDILNTKNLRQFIQTFASHVIGALDSNAHSALRHAGNFFQSIRPTLSFDALDGTPGFSLTFEDRQKEQTLKSIFSYIKQSGRRCYIAFDEFQQITEYPEKGTEALLRSYIQFIPNAHFIFAGSEQHMLSDMFMSAKRPFYLAAQMQQLKEIDLEEYYSFAAAFFRGQGRDLKKETFAYLYDLVDGQTWFVQVILNRLYGNKAGLEKDDVNNAVRQHIEEQQMVYENYYASLTTNQALLLAAIAKSRRVKEPLAQEFIAHYHLPGASSVRMALKSLEKQQFVYHDREGYIVYERFFALWLRSKAH